MIYPFNKAKLKPTIKSHKRQGDIFNLRLVKVNLDERLVNNTNK